MILLYQLEKHIFSVRGKGNLPGPNSQACVCSCWDLLYDIIFWHVHAHALTSNIILIFCMLDKYMIIRIVIFFFHIQRFLIVGTSSIKLFFHCWMSKMILTYWAVKKCWKAIIVVRRFLTAQHTKNIIFSAEKSVNVKHTKNIILSVGKIVIGKHIKNIIYIDYSRYSKVKTHNFFRT